MTATKWKLYVVTIVFEIRGVMLASNFQADISVSLMKPAS